MGSCAWWPCGLLARKVVYLRATMYAGFSLHCALSFFKLLNQLQGTLCLTILAAVCEPLRRLQARASWT